jgi:hypothetical protein
LGLLFGLHEQTAFNVGFAANPGGRPGAEVITGDTQDISEYLHFDWD